MQVGTDLNGSFAQGEVKLWRRDWSAVPQSGKFPVRLQLADNTLDWDIGWRNEGGFVVGDWPKGAMAIGWYPPPNPMSGAAYDPGEGFTG